MYLKYLCYLYGFDLNETKLHLQRIELDIFFCTGIYENSVIFEKLMPSLGLGTFKFWIQIIKLLGKIMFTYLSFVHNFVLK